MNRRGLMTVFHKHMIAPERPRLIAPGWPQIASTHLSWNRDTCGTQESNRQIYQRDQVVAALALSDPPRPTRDERHPNQVLIMKRPLGHEPMLTIEMAVIGGEHHQRIFRLPIRLQPVQYPADVFIHQADHAKINSNPLRHFRAVEKV